MSSLHPAFFTLCLRVLNLAVSNTWHLVCFAKGKGRAFTRGLGSPFMDTSLPDFAVLPQTFPQGAVI